MKRFKSSDLSANRAEVMKAARESGAIIEERRTNGDIIVEFVMISSDALAISTGHTIEMIDRPKRYSAEMQRQWLDRPRSSVVGAGLCSPMNADK